MVWMDRLPFDPDHEYRYVLYYHSTCIYDIPSSQVSYIGHDCEEIPDFLGETYGPLAKRLDLSFNQLR